MVLDSLDSPKSSLERLTNSVHSLLIQRFSQLVSAILHVKSSEDPNVNVPATYCNYRLTHSASELSGFTCTSSLTMNEKFQYRTRPPSAVLKIFEFIVSERVQVNPDNSRAMSALTFLLFKLNTLKAKIVKFLVSQSHGVMTVVYRIYTTAITPR